MDVGGKHLIIDIKDTNKMQELENLECLIPVMKKWMQKISATIVGIEKHPFKFGGYSLVFVLAESHFTVHTFPETKGISMDIYTCGNMDPFVLKDEILDFFGGRASAICLERGVE